MTSDRPSSRRWPQRIELPSWAFGNSGTRFKVFAQKGVPRDPYEKIADARPGPPLHRRRADRRAAHPVGPGRRLRRPRRVTPATWASRSGTINSNTFQDDDYMLGSVCQPGRRASGARRSTTCSSASTSWTRPARATSSCGSPTAPTTPARTTSAPARTGSPRRSPTVYARLGAGPADAARVQAVRAGVLHDGRARLGHRATSHCVALGPKAQVVVDTGHHAPGTNIEFIVASLLRAGQARRRSTSTRASTPTTT